MLPISYTQEFWNMLIKTYVRILFQSKNDIPIWRKHFYKNFSCHNKIHLSNFLSNITFDICVSVGFWSNPLFSSTWHVVKLNRIKIFSKNWREWNNSFIISIKIYISNYADTKQSSLLQTMVFDVNHIFSVIIFNLWISPILT